MITDKTVQNVGNRYIITDRIGAGGMGVVYRAHDRLTGQQIALKQVTVPGEQLEFATLAVASDFRLALAQEFRTLVSLRHPNIISVLDYGFDETRQPYFTMELLDNPRSFLDAGIDQILNRQLELLVQVFQAVSYLHRRGIIHRDLKPANILVTKDNIVKVLDFGLAVGRGYRSADGTIAGTLEYMAPEILMESPASEQSDIYALGMIAYELLTGQYPYKRSATGTLVSDIMNRMPDLFLVEMDDDLRIILNKMLEKNPADRYANISDLLSALNQYQISTGKSAIFHETEAARESFLQAARFVGRDRELQTLNEALQQMINGTGSAWLIAGESGVGKSRLVDELRAVAMVSGALVLRGQAIAEGGAPYLVLREILRNLCLHISLSDLEASVLKSVVPDIGVLLRKPIPDAPELAPEAAQERFFSVLDDVFRRRTQATVVILEDLHWSQESVTVLSRLSSNITTLPMLLIGTYRDDERPELPKLLPEMRVLKLERLTHDTIVELSTSILGETAGTRQSVVDLLERETEGNIYFIVEVLRTLAEEVGELDLIGHVTLPEKVFSGGIQAVLQRRLKRIPEQMREILQIAAVAGRELNLSILQTINPNLNLDHWLNVCSEAAVLDVQDGHWRFAHDKLREQVLRDLPDEQENRINGQVAEAIEKVYPNDPTQAAVLAFHWRKAGNLHKEAQYAAQAGELALKGSAYNEAVNYLTRALELYEKIGISPVDRAHLKYQLGSAYMSHGYADERQHYLEEALKDLGYPVPKTTPALIAGLLSESAKQVKNRWIPSKRHHKQREILLKASGIYEQLSEIYYFANQLVATAYATLKCTNLAEKAGGDSPELAVGLGAVSVMLSAVPIHSWAEKYGDSAMAVAERVGDPMATGWASLLAAFYQTGVGHWEKALRLVKRSLEMNEQVGDHRRVETTQQALGMIYTYQGMYDLSTQISSSSYPGAVYRKDLKAQSWSLTGQLEALVYKNPYKATDVLEKLEEILPHITDLGDRMSNLGLIAWVRLRRGEYDLALEFADMAAKTVEGTRPIAYYCFPAYVGIAVTYLALWGIAHNPNMQEPAKQACKKLHEFAGIYPFAVPSALLAQGRYEWLAGNKEKAQQLWKKSQDAAHKINMPYYEALAHYEAGRVLEKGETRMMHLTRAAEIFKHIGAEVDLEHALEMLEGQGA